jgi:hypothetical protein
MMRTAVFSTALIFGGLRRLVRRFGAVLFGIVAIRVQAQTRSRAATPRYDRPAGIPSSHGLQGAGRPNDGLEGVVPGRVALRQQYPKPV